MLKQVLIIDDDETLQSYLTDKIAKELQFGVEVCSTLEDAKKILSLEINRFFVIVADLQLPDARNDAVLSLLEPFNIPLIVLSELEEKVLLESIKTFQYMEFILKEPQRTYDYLLKLLHLLYYNDTSKIAIVDDSATSRLFVKSALEHLYMQIVEFENGKLALDGLANVEQVKIMIVDSQMPEMDGVTLVKEIRKRFSINELAIIGVSATDDSSVAVEFLKAGANDFITKPISAEGVSIRVVNNLEMLNYIQIAKESAVTDYLTGLYNRMYLHESGKTFFENAKRKNINITVAMVDIDFFKKVNDRYGHYAGDLLLKNIAQLFKEHIRKTDVVARYGGEEFCILLSNSSEEELFIVLDKLRYAVENASVLYKGTLISSTISIGACKSLESSFEAMVEKADKALYKAKSDGRNRVVIL